MPDPPGSAYRRLLARLDLEELWEESRIVGEEIREWDYAIVLGEPAWLEESEAERSGRELVGAAVGPDLRVKF